MPTRCRGGRAGMRPPRDSTAIPSRSRARWSSAWPTCTKCRPSGCWSDARQRRGDRSACRGFICARAGCDLAVHAHLRHVRSGRATSRARSVHRDPAERARGWRLDPGRLLDAWQPRVKLVFLCSPNNPTGNAARASTTLEAVCAALDGKAIVVIDEAYVEWSRATASPPGSAASRRSSSCARCRRRMRWPARASAR